MRPLAYSSARELTPAPGVATVRMHGPRLNPTSYNRILRLLTVLSLQPSMEVWPSEVSGTESQPHTPNCPSSSTSPQQGSPVCGNVTGQLPTFAPRPMVHCLPRRTTVRAVVCEPCLVTVGQAHEGSQGLAPVDSPGIHSLLPSSPSPGEQGNGGDLRGSGRGGPCWGSGTPPVHACFSAASDAATHQSSGSGTQRATFSSSLSYVSLSLSSAAPWLINLQWLPLSHPSPEGKPHPHVHLLLPPWHTGGAQ